MSPACFFLRTDTIAERDALAVQTMGACRNVPAYRQDEALTPSLESVFPRSEGRGIGTGDAPALLASWTPGFHWLPGHCLAGDGCQFRIEQGDDI